MNPWFLTEGDVIPFTKKDDKVVKLPNVGAYPDFLTGVADLQSRVEQGELSDEMYKKKYTQSCCIVLCAESQRRHRGL